MGLKVFAGFVSILGLVVVGSLTSVVPNQIAGLTGTPFSFIPLVLHKTAGNTPTTAATRTSTPTRTGTVTPTLTVVGTSTPTRTKTATPTLTLVVTSAQPTATTAVLESFEAANQASWLAIPDTSASGAATRSTAHAAAGSYSARLSTAGSSSQAQIRLNFSDAAGSHTWQERPGTWRWQRAQVYVPAATVAQLGPSEYVTLAGFWSSSDGTGWWLRVRQGGHLYMVGRRDFDNAAIEFRAYGTIPTDQWVSLEIGLHSQAGPGVKRAFAVLVNGTWFGWYHQGRMQSETYDRSAIGILTTNSADPLVVYVDEWGQPGSTAFPTGLDNRPTANVQEQDYRLQSGATWQIDWTTWENDLHLHAQYGLHSAISRLQSGRNLDRMPDVSSGWAEIEIDWPAGVPPTNPSSYFGPMVGFRKEINREENLEVIPIGAGNGSVDLVLEAWVNGGPVILATWPLPSASIGGSSHIPEPGDIIRVRWEQINATQLNVRASFYDASANSWHTDVINHTFNNASFSGNQATTNFTDGFHAASSITIDSTYYSIRRFKLGTLPTYP